MSDEKVITFSSGNSKKGRIAQRRGMFTLSNFVSNVLKTDQNLADCKLVAEDCIQKVISDQKICMNDLKKNGSQITSIAEIMTQPVITKIFNGGSENNKCGNNGIDSNAENFSLIENFEDHFVEGGPVILVTPESSSNDKDGPCFGSSMEKHTLYTISASMFATFCKFYNNNLLYERMDCSDVPNGSTFPVKKTCDQSTQTSTLSNGNQLLSKSTKLKKSELSEGEELIKNDYMLVNASEQMLKSKKSRLSNTSRKAAIPNINVVDIMDEINDLTQENMKSSTPSYSDIQTDCISSSTTKLIKRKRRKVLKHSFMCCNSTHSLASTRCITKTGRLGRRISTTTVHKNGNTNDHNYIRKEESLSCSDDSTNDAWLDLLTDSKKIASLSDQALLKIIRSYSNFSKKHP